jgi:SSS family solute:Na+ symporter
MTTLIIVACYLALLLGLGLFSNRLFRGTSSDYMLASHSIGPFLLLMSLFGTTMTAFALVGSTGEAYKQGIGVYGLLASASGIVHSLCFFLVGVKLWTFGRKYHYRTQVQFFRDRLDSEGIGVILFVLLVALVIPYVLIGVLGAGAVLNGVTQGEFEGWFFAAEDGGVANWIASGVICLVVLTYVFFGGMRGTAWANTFQTAVFMILGMVSFVVIANGLGGRDNFLENMQVASQAVARQDVNVRRARELFDKAAAITDPQQREAFIASHCGDNEELAERLRQMLQARAPLSDQDSKTTSPSTDQQQPHVVYMDRVHMTCEDINPTVFFTYLLIPLSVGMFPHVFQHWLTARSAATFKLPIVAHPIFILIVWAPCVLIGAWATTSLAGVPEGLHPNAVLSFLVKSKAGPVLGGLLTAGILAAIMSSLDSQFLCLGTMFTTDIVLHYRRGKPLSEMHQVLLARGFIVAIVAVTFLLSLWNQPRVFPLGVWCFAGFTGLFPLAVGALYWKRLTAAGAYAAVVATGVSWGVLFWRSGILWRPDFDKYKYTVDVTLFGETYKTEPVATIILCSIAAMVLVSLITPPPSEKTLAKFFS